MVADHTVEGTTGAGGNMVFVKVRETYDLHTTRNKMTVIGIHTPSPNIIKSNYPGLLMQCKMYRPYSCDVKVACASVLPLDPQGVGTAEGDVAPEDVFNPILYKAMSNIGMSQLEARINYLSSATYPPGSQVEPDVIGSSVSVDVDTVTSYDDEFDLYYGILSTAHDWKKANPQAGLEMRDLVPIVHEIAYNIGDNHVTLTASGNMGINAPDRDNSAAAVSLGRTSVIGGSKRLPFINCTEWSGNDSSNPTVATGFGSTQAYPGNAEHNVPFVNCVVGAIIVPPSRRHELFYRLVCEWTLEFTSIRSIGEITSWGGLNFFGVSQHYQNYDYSTAKAATVGDVPEILNRDTSMVSANVDIEKVM